MEIHSFHKLLIHTYNKQLLNQLPWIEKLLKHNTSLKEPAYTVLHHRKQATDVHCMLKTNKIYSIITWESFNMLMTFTQ